MRTISIVPSSLAADFVSLPVVVSGFFHITHNFYPLGSVELSTEALRRVKRLRRATSRAQELIGFAGYPGWRRDDTVTAYDDVMSDLNKIVDLRTLADDGILKGAAIYGGVRTD